MLISEYDLDKKLQRLEHLYGNDPLQFENLRREIIDQEINSYPAKHQQRARGIQFTLDCELNKYKNPIVRMNRMAREESYGKNSIISILSSGV